MRRWNWGKAALMALGLVGAARAQYPMPGDPSQVVVIREAGKPEQRCVIEYALQQEDGKVMYYVRDLATGERLRVIDARTSKATNGPIVGRVIQRLHTPTDVGMTKALASSPAKQVAAPRTPTAAELASAAPAKPTQPAEKPKLTAAPVEKPKAAPAKPKEDQISPVQVQLTQLQEAVGPSQRESAAMVLTVSDARTMPEVVKAIMNAARNDSSASVRVTCIRCLFKLSNEVPDVVPVIEDCRTDLSPEVSSTAAKAIEEIQKRK